jgi:hypothetical protein
LLADWQLAVKGETVFKIKGLLLMKTISALHANDDWTLDVTFTDGAKRRFDMKPLFACDAFTELRDIAMFKSVRNGGYFIEWANNADLSADTLYREGTACEESAA